MFLRAACILCLLCLALPVMAQEKIPDALRGVLQNAIDGNEPPPPAAPNAATPPPAQAETVEQVTPVTTAPAATASSTADLSAPSFENKKFAVLQTLDKVTARTATVTVPVGTPQAVGPLFVDIKSCQKTPPTEQPEATSFIQVWEAKPKPKTKQQIQQDSAAGANASQWVFSGWMFASSPALSAMDHPIYDVWLKDCIDAPAGTPAAG